MHNALDADLPFVGRIVKLWTDRVSGKMRLRVNWFYRPEDTRGKRLPAAGARELYFSDAEDTNDVASICGRIAVLTFSGAGHAA